MATWFVSAWGLNSSGQCNVPAPNSGFIFASGSVGNGHSLGLKANGSIVAWGRGSENQCVVPSGASGYCVVSAGNYHSLGLKSDGSISGWGLNTNGQCTIPSPNSGFMSVAGGGWHTLGLKSSGSIVAWGSNSAGQGVAPTDNSGFIAVAAGQNHSLGLKGSGSITAWGNGGNGQCTVPTPNSGFIAIAACAYHSVGLKASGSISVWGYNSDGQGVSPPNNSGFIAIAAGYYHNLGLKSDGSITAWGRGIDGQCVVASPNSGYVSIAAGGYHSLGFKEGAAVSGSMTLYMPGSSSRSIVVWGDSADGKLSVPQPNTDFISVAGRYYHCLGLKANGSIVAWGLNTSNQCTVPSGNSGYVAIAAGWQHSLGLKASGSVVAWGRSTEGQCTVPSPNSGFIAVAAGYLHSLGLKASGSITAWGANDQGQGNIPAPNSGFIAISAGDYFSLGLKASGSISACGESAYNQLAIPAPNSGFVAIAAGYRAGAGLKASGSIVTWGNPAPSVPLPNSGFVALAQGDCLLAKRSNGSLAVSGRVPAVPSLDRGFGSLAAGINYGLGVVVADASATTTSFILPHQLCVGTCPVMLCGGIVRTLGVYLYCSGIAYDDSSILYSRGHLPFSGSSTIFMRGNVLQDIGVTSSGHGHDLWVMTGADIYSCKTNMPSVCVAVGSGLSAATNSWIDYDPITNRIFYTTGSTTIASSGVSSGVATNYGTGTFASWDPYSRRVYVLYGASLRSYDVAMGDMQIIATLPTPVALGGIVSDAAHDYLYVHYYGNISGGWPTMRIRLSNPNDWTMVASGQAVQYPNKDWHIDRVAQVGYCRDALSSYVVQTDLVTGARAFVLSKATSAIGTTDGAGVSGLVDMRSIRVGYPLVVRSIASPGGFEAPVCAFTSRSNMAAPALAVSSVPGEPPRFTCFVTGPRSLSSSKSCTIRGGRYPDNDGYYQPQMKSYWPCDDTFEYLSQTAGSGSTNDLCIGRADSAFMISSSGAGSLVGSGGLSGITPQYSPNPRICPVGQSGFFLSCLRASTPYVYYGTINPSTLAISGIASGASYTCNYGLWSFDDGQTALGMYWDGTNYPGLHLITPTATGYITGFLGGGLFPGANLSGRRFIAAKCDYVYTAATVGLRICQVVGTGAAATLTASNIYSPFVMPSSLGPYPAVTMLDDTRGIWTVSRGSRQHCGSLTVSGLSISFGPALDFETSFTHGSTGPSTSVIFPINADTAVAFWLKTMAGNNAFWAAAALKLLPDGSLLVGPTSQTDATHAAPWLSGHVNAVPLGLQASGGGCAPHNGLMSVRSPTTTSQIWSIVNVNARDMSLRAEDVYFTASSGVSSPCSVGYCARGEYQLGSHASGVILFKNQRVLPSLSLTRTPSGVAAKSLTVSAWSSGTLNSSGTIRVSDGFVHEFTTSGMRLTGASGSIWAPYSISGVTSDQWHMTTASWHPSGALSYTPRISVDGEAWVTLEPTGTVSGVTVGGTASISGTVPNSVTGAVLDEVVVWSRTNLMEDQVLENLYNLGSSGYQVVEYYDFFEHDQASGLNTLFSRGHLSIVESSVAYMRGGFPSIDGSGVAYVRGHEPLDSSGVAYLCGSELASSTGTVYVLGHEFVDNANVLYMRGHEPTYYAGTVYMAVPEPANESGVAYLRGHEPVDSSGVAYLRGHEPLNGNTIAYLRGHGPIGTSGVAYVRGHEPLEDNAIAYLHGHEPLVCSGFAYLRGHEPSNSSGIAYLRGHEPLDNSIAVYMRGHEQPGVLGSLFVRGHEPVDLSDIAYVRGHEPVDASRPCIIQYAHEPIASDIAMYLRGHEPLDSNTTVYMRGHEAPGSLGTLYVRGHEPLDGDTVAYLRGHEPVDTSGFAHMRGRMPAGKLPFDDNVVFYHECDDLIEFTHDQTWSGEIVVADGQILSSLADASSLDASSPAIYPSTTSATRLTVGLWCMNPSIGGSLITAGASLSASISGSTVWLNSARWSVPALSTINDDQWHFVLLDFTNVADGWWTLGASIDGGILDPIGVQDAGYVPLPVASVSPGLSVAGDTTRIDEVIVWRNLSRLDSVDIGRLYSLAETYDQPFSVYRDYFDDYVTQSMDCYLAADTFAVGTTTLVMRGPIATSGDTTAFVGAYDVFHGSCTLAFHHPSIATYTAPCFLKVPEPINASTTAFLWGNESTNDNRPCVLPKAHDVLASGCPAVLRGHEPINRLAPAYLRGHAVASGNCTCVLADVHGVMLGARTAYIVGFVSDDDSRDLFVRSHEVVSDNRPAYIHGPTATSGDTTAFVGAYDVHTGTCTLAFHFPSIATYTSPCFLKVPEPSVQNCPLVMVGREPIFGTKTCVLVGHESQSPAGTLYERGHKVVVATMPLMLQSPGLASGTTSLYMSTKTVAAGTTTAMVRGSVAYPTKVWWCDASNPLNVVHSKRVNGDDPWVVSSGVGDPRDIAVNIQSGFLFWTNSAPFSAITRSDFDGSNRTNILSGAMLPMAMDLDTYGDKVYWTDTVTNKIMSCNLDGSNVTTVVAMTGAADPVGLRYYHPERALIFADRTDGTIKKFSIRSGVLRTLVTVGSNVARVDIDPRKRRVYWTMRAPINTIMYCSMTGAGTQTLYSAPSGGVSDPVGVAIDWKNSDVYWTNRGTSKVLRGPLTYGATEVFASGLGATLDGITLDVPADPAVGYAWVLSDLTGSFDNAPQLIGNLDYVGVSGEVTIKVWRLDRDGPVEVTPVGKDGCYPIGDTGRWGWSTAGLPVASNVRTMYYYEMYASTGSVFKGEFVWQTRPDSKVSHSRRRRRKEK